jgi:hypothetical protein
LTGAAPGQFEESSVNFYGTAFAPDGISAPVTQNPFAESSRIIVDAPPTLMERTSRIPSQVVVDFEPMSNLVSCHAESR